MKNEKLFTQIKEVIGEKHMLNHPFYKTWSKGELTKEELRDYLLQYLLIEKSFPQLMSQLHANTKDASMRQVMLKNLNHEELGEENHVAQLVRLCREGFEITDAEIDQTQPNAETIALIERLQQAVATKDIREGLAAMIVYKQQVSDVAATKIDGLRDFYDITDAKALEFYETHAEVNRDYHQLLDAYLQTEEQPEVMRVVQEVRDAFWSFLDGVTTQEILARCEM